MSVGGRILEIKGYWATASGKPVVRIWVMDGYDEVCVFAVCEASMPSIGESIWWHSDRIYFDGDKQSLLKVGNSFQPGKHERMRLS